jgi:hypothetical protein
VAAARHRPLLRAGPLARALARTLHLPIFTKDRVQRVLRDGPEQGFKLEYDGDTFLLDSKPYTITASDQCK